MESANVIAGANASVRTSSGIVATAWTALTVPRSRISAASALLAETETPLNSVEKE